jgi:hydroxyethylthiazole kinase-like uncharacterized protein yjeF
MTEITSALVRSILPRRDPEGHKGTFGKVYCLCGSVGFTGAPVFASRAAVRTGAGLVYLGVPERIWPIVAVKSDEAMPFPLPDRDGMISLAAKAGILQRIGQCDAVLLGCGLGRSEESDVLSRDVIASCEKPLVVDADGINALAGHINTLSDHLSPVILTPHEGEFARLDDGLQHGSCREDVASKFTSQNGVYLVLKGHRTVVAAPDGRVAVNTTGNSGMAKGGSGDVLSGMITALLAQKISPFEACCAAVWLHGRAGDLAAAERGEYGMTPTDLLEQIPYAIKTL